MARKRNRQRHRRNKDMAVDSRGLQGAMPPGMMQGGMPMQGPPQSGMAAGMAPEQPMPAGEDGEEEPNVTPEEQAIYGKFMENYYTIMYVQGREKNGEEASLVDQVRAMFTEIKNPVDALANATVNVVKYLADSAEAAGKTIPPDVLMHAGTEVLEDLAELAESGGHHEYTQEELDGSLYKAMDLYRELEQSAGRLNMDEIKSDYEMMSAADQQGKLEEVLPGVTEAAGKMPQPEMEEDVPAGGGEPVPPQQPMGMGRV